MRKEDFTKIDDINIAPSDTLKRETLALMESSANTREISCKPRSLKSVKRVTLIAAMVALVFVLMGVGVRVFDYLAYVPGLGIITSNQEQIYTLKERARIGTYHVEAMSAVPVTEGEYKGMWKVHILTDKIVFGSMLNNPKHTAPVYLTGKDGEKYPINRSGGNSELSRYEGYAVIDGSGEYTLTWDGRDYTVELQKLENTKWADYSYPVDEGITLIAFPLAENSQYITYDVILDAESENITYWVQFCDMVLYDSEIRVTDADGNIYYASSKSGSAFKIPDSQRDYGVNSFLNYKIEHIGKLNKMPTAPIVKIEASSVELMFHGMENTPEYATITIPELNEVISGESLPNNGLIIDDHGIKVKIEEMTTKIDEKNNDYRLVVTTSIPEVDFEECVSRLDIHISCIDKNSQDGKKYSSGVQGLGYVRYRFPELGEQVIHSFCSIYGDGDRDTDGVMNATYGDEVGLTLWGINITIDGEWVIDFSADN